MLNMKVLFKYYLFNFTKGGFCINNYNIAIVIIEIIVSRYYIKIKSMNGFKYLLQISIHKCVLKQVFYNVFVMVGVTITD